MRVFAHERILRKRKTVLMESRDFNIDASRSRWIVFDEDAEAYRYSVVPDWYDAEAMNMADVSGEVIGQRVIAYAGQAGNSVGSPVGSSPDSGNGLPGFLFCGDDGDSLWFWPESEDMAFRFESETAGRLRSELSEEVSRLVNQGALVFCYKNDVSGESSGLLVFPGLDEQAA